MILERTMGKVQQAYDALNCSLMAIKNCALHLRNKADPTAIASAMETSKKCQAMGDELEQMLLGEKRTTKEHAARKMLLRAGTEYQSLRIKQLELEAINRTVNEKPKTRKALLW